MRLPEQKLPKVAYFCMEYGLDNGLPIYAGGLGILAGDYLKAAKDLNVPVVGIGILWRQDYTTQLIGEDGYPYDLYPRYDYENVKDTGVTVKLRIRGGDVTCRVRLVDQYENAPLYLLDTNFEGSEHGWMTEKLYGGSGQDRVAQEMILGIGGVRALRALGIDVDVYHFNEGHAVFAGLELIREKMSRGMTFEEAWEATKKEVVFTTHTPVEAGNETHDYALLGHMEAFNGLTYEQLKALGGDPFNMTVAALRLSEAANAVSRAHGETARNMWKNVEKAAPIMAITNGVHVNTWQNPAIREAYKQKGDLWQPHLEAKKKLFNYIRTHNNVIFDPDVLTIGFARRAAAYKRGGLIFRNMELLSPLLKEGKLQLVYSGKAHPHDGQGKAIIREIVNIGKEFPNRITFLENYDMHIARLMIQGCDAWLNNPLRPLEASGTSGMKAALNGVLNISVVDGWVGEGVIHKESGWLLDRVLPEDPNQMNQDVYDLKAFYEVLLADVMPVYYVDRPRWTRMMQKSIEMAQEKFSSERMLKEYYEQLYLKAVAAQAKIPLALR
ncbi:alpha-glucan family phosphorylase [Thermanaerosceptrum fracticalcis]|uniref:glycogen phosphorylase n=1 Tax=Thermanaerosceptrum fracticalcis TaxID=1712410 RepID=A0A7G6DYV3_THEFR|nr:alpha-glucan family phosphorylase [Thermanaerosceptrum fracticalcis]QNB45007.1 alpha-glucan family phosphorylase [Thermanaerosceptrum fracticalcis]